MTTIITGAAGFIGYHLSSFLLRKGIQVVGADNLNDYYDASLKEARLKQLQISQDFTQINVDIADSAMVNKIFNIYHPDIVINLAAQAGVRYSITNPDAYIQSNLIGFYNIIEACRHHPVEHLVYASSSSVYGMNDKIPFSTTDKTDSPVSLYAATKKANELMAYSYSKLYNIPATGLRFFTVYGPAGRPDMAYFSFTKKLLAGEKIRIFNYGNCKRDFTYIDDIVTGIVNVMNKAPDPDVHGVRHKVYNIGNNKPENLLDFVSILQQELIKVGLLPRDHELASCMELVPMQPGDVETTYADVDDLIRDFDFKPSTSLREGLGKFAAWYKDYYHGGESKC